MSENVTGVVEEVIGDKKIKVGGLSYSAFDGKAAGIPDLTVGDSVSFQYTEKEGNGKFAGVMFKNIKGRVTKMTTPLPATASATAVTTGRFGNKGVFPVPVTDGSRSIIRQNSVTNATAIMTAILGEQTKTAKWEDKMAQAEAIANAVVDVARILESYSAGDVDLEEAERALGEVA